MMSVPRWSSQQATLEVAIGVFGRNGNPFGKPNAKDDLVPLGYNEDTLTLAWTRHTPPRTERVNDRGWQFPESCPQKQSWKPGTLKSS